MRAGGPGDCSGPGVREGRLGDCPGHGGRAGWGVTKPKAYLQREEGAALLALQGQEGEYAWQGQEVARVVLV